MSARTWTPEEVAKRRAMLADPACLLDGKELILSLLDEIERLQKRDERREKLLRDALDELQTALSTEARKVAARIRAELGEKL